VPQASVRKSGINIASFKSGLGVFLEEEKVSRIASIASIASI